MKRKLFALILFGILFVSRQGFCTPMQYTFVGSVNTVFNYGDPIPLISGDMIQYVFLLDVDAYTATFVSGPFPGNYGATTIQEAQFNSLQNGFSFHNDGNHLYVDVDVQGGSIEPVKDWAIGHWSMIADWNAEFSGSGFEGTVQLVDITSSIPVPDPVPEPASIILLGLGIFGLAFLKTRKNKA
jgi:hypothetical protein